jgi:RimJ/RimL family protein N-acetyltransferase
VTIVLDIRSVARVEDFVAPDDDPNDLGWVEELWEDGTSRPEWTFVATDAGSTVGRAGFVVTPSVTDPAWVGLLPPSEMTLFGAAAWAGEPVEVLAELVRAARRALGDAVPDVLEIRTNPAVHSRPEERLALAAALDLTLFQEKEGVLWEDHGEPVQVPQRIRSRSLADTGPVAYAEVFARIPEGTLDRNDRWYYERVDPQHWAAQMMEFADGAEETWLVAECEEGPVGMVAISPFDGPDTATISYIGVLPEHRGNGYVDDLLAAGTAAAQRAGFTRILSDVDTQNHPMLAAMERAGHHASATPWHVWSHRGTVR